MSRSVTVTAPARLHLGFLDIDGSLGRRFGSLGLAIDRPVTRLTARRGAATAVEGPESERAARYLRTLQDVLGLAGHHRLVMEATSPAHSGLGSGTQIALAVSAAVRKLHGLPLDVKADAERLGRGGRSGVGVGLFERGGFVLDGGRTADSGPAPIVVRHAFPEDWRIILVHDRRAAGIHGDREARAFADLPPFPGSTAAHLCHLVLMRALPGLVERDVRSFGAAIAEVQAIVGDWFAKAQGGRYASPLVARAMELLMAAGAHGGGQSSWGPTGFAFAGSASQAERLASAVLGNRSLGQIECEIVRGNNRGATIMATEAAMA